MRDTSCITLIDPARQAEIDNFYQACQMHRDQCKDNSGRLHPLDYFERATDSSACRPDLTSTYLKFPIYYIPHKQPLVLPIHLGRTVRFPTLESAFQPRYTRHSRDVYSR